MTVKKDAKKNNRTTGGQAGMRGYLVQTLIALLDGLGDERRFVSLTLEPDHLSEKFDLLWEYPQHKRAVQVKSSINLFTEPDVRRWAAEMEKSALADEYHLCLVGLCGRPVAKLGQVGKVYLEPKNLDLPAFREQAAHRLDHFLRKEKLDPGTPQSREMLADALTARLAAYSTTGKPLMRADLVKLLRTWVGHASESSPQSLTITQSFVSLLIYAPNGRSCSGRFLVSNSGPSICKIEDIVPSGDNIPLPECNLVAVGHWPGRSVNEPGTQKLPISVLVNQPIWVHFRTVETAELYRGELPATVILKVFFDCAKEPICRTLKRVPGNNQYREE